MAQWRLEHRVFAYDSFVKNNESVVTTQREFRRHFRIGRHGAVPNRSTILRWVNNLRTKGQLALKPPGATRTSRTPENVERVRQAVLRSPRRSTRHHAQTLRIPRTTVRRILHSDLHFHPYKLAIVQKLQPNDFAQRRAFSETILELLAENQDAIILMSDEAHFHLNGFVNRQNCRYWATENPKSFHERPLHSPKVTVWCAVSKVSVIGPYFFEEGGHTVTVNSDRYVQMLNNFLGPELLRLRRTHPPANLWFQQDGATAHTARNSMRVVREMFPRGNVISRLGDVPWPPRSPDLTSCDFFLWGYLKSKVYACKPRTLEELKTSIRRQIEAIDQNLLVEVYENFVNRLTKCVAQDGQHMTDVIFHK